MFAADEIESPSSKNRPPPCIAFLVDTSVTPLYLDNQKVFGTCTVETLTITDIHSNIYIKGKIEKYTNQVKLAIIKILLYFQYYVDKKFQWGYQFYTSDSRTLLLSSNKNKFFKLNQDSINMFVENFKKLLFKNIQEKYLKSKSSSSNTSTSSFNCLNNLVITLRECLASFNWNYSRDVGFLSPIKKKKKSVILHHFLFLMTPLPDSYFALVKYVENQNVYHDLLQKHNSIEEEEEEEEDPSALKEKMDLLLDKFQNEFIKKALWTAYLQNKIGISWIDTNPRYEEDKIIDLEIWSKMQYIEEKYIKESIETLLSVYGGSIINLYDISQESSLLPFSSYISNYRTKAINMAIGELLINQGKDRREKMILENEEKKMKNILWSGSLTHTKGKSKTNLCKIDIIPLLREQKQSLFKYMDTFKKNSEYEFLSKLSKDIPPFSLKRKSINVVNLIDTNIVDSAWLEGQEYFCQLSHDLEEMEDLISSLFFFKAMNLLKLGMIVEVYLNIRIKNNSDEEFNNDGDLSLLSNDDTEDYESKKYYGILIPLTECFGFIRIINSQAAETIQSYIRSMKKRTSPKQENIFKHLSEDDLFELLSIDLINKSTEDNEINHHEFSMNYLERWYKSILNNFNSTEVKKINLTELMLLSPNSENVLPKEKKDNSKNHSKKSTNKNQYQLFTQDGIIELYRKREKEKAQLEKQMEENQNNDENSEHGNSGKEEQEEKKKKKTVKDIINNLKSLIYNIIYYEKNMVEDFGQTLNTIHNKLFSEEDANEKIKTTKEDGDRSIDSVSTESLDFDEKNDENSREEMKKLYLSTLETAIVMTPEQIDHKYKNFVNYINALSTISHSSDSNENASDKSDHECENNPSLPNTINKNDFFEEGIITEEEEGQIQAWKLHNEKEMDKIEEKVTRMKIEEAQIQVIVLLEYLRLHKKEKINFPDVLLDAENHPPTNLYSKKKEFKKPRKKSDTTIIKNILETLMDKLCIWMTLDQFPAFDSVNTLDNELSDDKITNFVNCILKELFNKDLPKIIKHLYTKVSGGFEEEDPKSNLLSPKFKEKMLKSREKYKIQKPQKIQSLSEKLREESQSLTTNKMAGKNFFNRLFKDREVVIVKKESKHKKKNKKNLVVKEPKETTTVPKQLLPFDEDEEEEVKMVLKPRKTFNSMSILSNLMLTPRKRRNKNELLKNITKSPYKMSNWITKNDPLPLQSKKPNTTSEFIVFAPKTPSKKNKKSRNNVYFVNNTNGQPLDTTTTTDKNKSDSMEFKVCQTPMVPKRSQSMIMEERKGISLVRSQSLLEELNSIAAADDKENGNSNANRMTSISPQDKDTSMDSAKLEIKNLFKASFSQNNILSKSYSFNIGTTTSTTVDKKEKESNFSFDIKSLYDSYLTNRSQSSNDSPNDHRFNIFSRSYHRRNSEEEESNRSGESITFRKWLPKDINDPSDESSHEKTPPIAHDQGSRKTSKNEDSTHFNGLDDLEQLKHHYSQHSATENRRISFSPSPSPTPMSYSREISRSPTFNKLNRNSSFTLGLDSQPSFLDFTTTTQEGESIFPSATNHAITTTPKADRRTSFINFNPRAFDISSEGSSSGGGGGDGPSPTPSAPTTNQTFIFQKPWSRHQTLTESPTQATAKEEEIMRTPSKRKLKQSLPMFSFSSPGMKRKNSSFGDNDFPSSSKVSPSPTSSTHSTLSKIGDEDPSHYLKVPILSTPKKRRLNLLKVTNTKSPTMDQNYLAPTAPFSSQDSIDNTGLDVVMTTPSKKYNIFTVAPTPTKYTSLFD